MKRQGTPASRCYACFMQVFFIAAAIAIVGGIPFAGTAAPLDETMPSSIPDAVISDWELQDNIASAGYSQATQNIISQLPPRYASKAVRGSTKDAYYEACHLRRVARMEPYAPQLQKVLYARHYDLGGAIIGFIEDVSDNYSSPVQGAKFNFPAMSTGSNWTRGGALLLLEMGDYYGSSRTLVSETNGVIRDPCINYSATKVAYACSKDRSNGYKIYELDLATNAVTPLTTAPTGLRVSDFEPCYLPNGDILFNSTRCYGQVDCNFNMTCNLFIMNHQGKYLRRIGYDQVHTFSPTMMSDGKVLYTRWEYNDRNVSNVFGIFVMNIDGCRQTEYFGNQTSWPATFQQAREIPGSNGMVMATIGGHMGPYCGDLCIVDPNISRNGTSAVQLIAPKRASSPDFSMDGVAPEKKLFQNPYPIDAKWFLISYRPTVNDKFGIYFMDVDGNRELLATDASMSVSQPLPLVARPLPPIPTYQADYTKTSGEITMTNAYYGLGTGSTVRAGTIKKVRVIALEYRINPWFGNVGASAYTCTPVARWMGSWEAKRIVGEMTVESDGSAAFIVPARVPIYLQLIDADGCAIQSMRSWMTLQPGEKFSCYGCHEDKNVSPPPVPNPIASTPIPLEPFFGINDDYLSFPKYIQPILDAKCISCHTAGHQSGLDLSGNKFWTGDLTNDADNVTACKYWSTAYYNLSQNKYVNYITVMDQAPGRRPNSVGAVRSPLISRLKSGHSNANLTAEEMGKICAWIDLCIPYSGHYSEGMKPTDSVAYVTRVQQTRGKHEDVELANIQEFIAAGGYGAYVKAIPRGKRPGGSAFSRMARLKVRFSASGRKLTVQVPCEGNLFLMNVLGRRILARTIDREAVGSVSSISLPEKMPGGVYIIEFTGTNVTEHYSITVL
ncbi:MAG: hypothetical protein JW768_08125 [Chitinispirillaceae bacterium]|nr:hypothetical protein [Chitinispirillaceae bacterium]